MKFGSEWKCGNCGKIYTFTELFKLNKVKLIESDDHPEEQHGYTFACDCGYRFHTDKWRLNDILKIKIDGEDRDIWVSTIDLELNHGWEGEDLWYETMIFVEEEGKEKIECYLEHRYTTKDEAIKDHNKLIEMIEQGKYTIKNNDKKILLIDSS